MKQLAIAIACLLLSITAIAQYDKSWSYTEALPSDYTKSVLEVKSLNEIWVGTYNGITRFNGTGWVQETDLGGAGSLNAYEMIEADDGAVWVALGGGGVSKYESGTWTNYTVIQGLASNSNWAIAQDSTGKIWAGSTDAGVSVFDGDSWAVFTTDDGLSGNSVVEILPTYRGDVWLGTANGASIWDGSSFTNLTIEEGMPSNLVRDLYQDFNGNVCVATSNGVGFYNGAEWTYLTTDDGLPTNNIIAMTQMHNGDFLFASDIGLIHYDLPDFTLLDYDNGLAEDIVKSITVDTEGKIWVCSPFHGLSLVDTENAWNIIRTNQDLVNNEINCLYSDGEKIWIATNQGANSYDSEIWRTFNMQDGLAGDTVLDIKTKNTSAYFACIGGVSIYTDQSYSEYTMADGLLSDTVMSVEVLDDGTIYLGTYYGLMEIQTNGTMTNYTTDDGLANDTVWVVLKDNSGDLWAGTNNGLSKFSGGTFTNFGQSDLGGVRVKSLLLDYSGNLYAATENSLASYIASSWTSYPYSGFTGPVSDLAESGTWIYLLKESDGNVYYFDRMSYNYGSSSVFTHQNAIEMVSPSYLYIGNNNGVNRLRIATEDYNDVTPVHPSCPESSDGSITIEELTDNSPYQYSIDNGENYTTTASFSGLEPGRYHIKVKNAIGQITKDSTVLLEPQHRVDAVIGLDQINCNGDANGVIELFLADPSCTYLWSDAGTGALRENLDPGGYAVTVSDPFCSVVRHNTIVEPEQLSLSATKEDVLCFGDNTGSIDLSVSGGSMPYEFAWDNAAETEDLGALNAGDYTVTLTDAHACTATHTETIVQPLEALSVSESIQNVQCYGGADGEILLTVSGGTSPYEYLWNDGSEEEDRLNISNGEYSVTITDAHACTISADYSVTAPDALDFTLVVYEDVLCYGESNGSVSVVTEGGTGTHTFEWTLSGEPGIYSTEQNLTDLSAGEYNLIVTDENACSIDSTVTIDEPVALGLDFDLTPITCQGYDDAVIEALPSGGTAPYISFYWSYGDDPAIIGVNAEIADCQSGWYHVTVTDAHYCEIEDSIEVIDPPAHTVELLVTDMPCHGNEAGEIEVVVDGGATTDLTYQWSNGAGDVATATGLSAGNYIVTITDATNCELTEEAEVSEPELADLGAFDDSGLGWLCGGSSTTLDAGSGYVSYAWSTGSDQQSIEVDTEDTYTVFVVDADGCEYGDTIEVELSYPYDDEELCFLTVDEDNYINVIWNKTPGVGTSEYRLYRENTMGTDFELLTTIPYSQPSIYIDTDSDASQADEAYKISVVDTCGNESPLSEMQSSMTLSVTSNINGGCTLNWDEYEGYFVVYYFIMRGTSPDNMEVVDSVLYNHFDYAEMNPDPDGVYYKIMVKRPDACSPGDGTDYGFAYSNIVYCDNLTGIAQMNYGAVNVYPNPFNDNFTIDLYLNIEKDVKLRLYNSMGQLVYDTVFHTLPAGENMLNIPQLDIQPGLYNLQLHFGDQLWQEQIVKQ